MGLRVKKKILEKSNKTPLIQGSTRGGQNPTSI